MELRIKKEQKKKIIKINLRISTKHAMIRTCESAPSTGRKLATKILLIHYQLSTIACLEGHLIGCLKYVQHGKKINFLKRDT